MKRLFDIVVSLFSLIILFPLFLLIAIWVVIDSGFPVLYVQQRVGRGNKDFPLLKFRTMHQGADQKGLLTVGSNDHRITRAGGLLRKYKLDELPQLFNILRGQMSFVGPRPEVRKYVDLYTSDQKKVLSVKPGLTDYASLQYLDENTILQQFPDPEKAYIETIMPDKLMLNIRYINHRSLLTDIKIILKTIGKIVR
ncbi:MAG: sugar transferase [Bacteroidales bacterium]|nr:sugar transferase [Bacteroidales bacterium]